MSGFDGKDIKNGAFIPRGGSGSKENGAGFENGNGGKAENVSLNDSEPRETGGSAENFPQKSVSRKNGGHAASGDDGKAESFSPKSAAAPRPMRGPLGGGPMGGITGERAKNFKGAVKKLARYLSDYKLRILSVVIFAAGSTAFTIYAPRLLGEVTNALYTGVTNAVGGEANIDLAAIRKTLTLMLAIYIASSAFAYLQGFIMSGISMKITYRMRRDIAEKVNKLPFKYFDTTTHGEVMSRLTNDTDAISQSLNQIMTQIISSVTGVIGIAAMMLTISAVMTLASLAVVPVSMLLMIFVIRRSQKYFKNQFGHLGRVNGFIEEIFSGISVVKSFNAEDKCLGEFTEYNDNLYGVSWKANFYSGMMMPLTGLIGNLAYVVICALGGYLVAEGIGGAGGAPLLVGGVQSFIVYIRQFNQNVSQVANISNVLQQTAAAAERVFEFLEEKEESPDAESSADVKDLRGIVDFENVRFGYTENNIVIKNFSRHVEEGQKIAVVGPTGAGKTTIVKLLMRFYELNGGRILIDGRDIKELKRNDLRSLFGMVLQDTWLFNGTIMENIRYGRGDATDGEVVSAAVTAHADHFIRALPNGYNMILNEDATNISQGQKQLLTIARAILANPKILILDEATSSVDTRTEILIQNAMDELMKNRTSFVIAHRLSTIKNADVILVLRDGDVVESGNHGELMAKGGFYSELYKSQFTQG